MGIDTSQDVSRSLVQSIRSIELALSTRLRVCTRVSTTRCYIVRQLSDTRESLGQMTGSARLASVGIRIVAVGADNLNIYICARLNQWLNECSISNLHVHVSHVRGDQSGVSHRARFTCLAMNSDALASPLFQASYSKRARAETIDLEDMASSCLRNTERQELRKGAIGSY